MSNLNSIKFDAALRDEHLQILESNDRNGKPVERALLCFLKQSSFQVRMNLRGNPGAAHTLLDLADEALPVIEALRTRLALLETAQARLLSLDLLEEPAP